MYQTWECAFKKHIQNLCCTAHYKLNALRRIRKYLSLQKSKALRNAFIDSEFNYASIVWMFGKKTIYLKMHKTHNKTLKVIYQSDTSYEDLLVFTCEIYKRTVSTSPPEFLWSFFKDKEVPYNLIRNPALFILHARSTYFGTNQQVSFWIKKNYLTLFGNIDCGCVICRR